MKITSAFLTHLLAYYNLQMIIWHKFCIHNSSLWSAESNVTFNTVDTSKALRNRLVFVQMCVYVRKSLVLLILSKSALTKARKCQVRRGTPEGVLLVTFWESLLP